VTNSDLSIGDVAERTGVPIATLRMWESRHEFPTPTRLPSGHRRYSGADCELIERVAADREAGYSLPSAIERARATAAEPEPSIYAALRRRRGDLMPYLLPKSTLMAISHAIEDECSARAVRPIMFGAFQRERFYRHAEKRWREFAHEADLAVVFADFPKRQDPPGAPIELPVERSEPMAREWALLCDGADYSACLSARERAGQDDVEDASRLFEALWSVEGSVVREGSRLALALAARTAPELADGVAKRLSESASGTGNTVAMATALTNRIVAYVGDGRLMPEGEPPASAGA